MPLRNWLKLLTGGLKKEQDKQIKKAVAESIKNIDNMSEKELLEEAARSLLLSENSTFDGWTIAHGSQATVLMLMALYKLIKNKTA